MIFKLKEERQKCQSVSDRITEKQKFALTSECCEQKMSSWWWRNLCLHSERISQLSKGDISPRITQLLQGQLNRLCSFNRSQLLFTVLVKKWQLSEWLTLYCPTKELEKFWSSISKVNWLVALLLVPLLLVALLLVALLLVALLLVALLKRLDSSCHLLEIPKRKWSYCLSCF